MKFIAFLLSIYILGLSFVTCNDDAEDMSSDTIVASISKGDHQNSGELDLCSPFCYCQCCQVSIDTMTYFSYKLLTQDFFAKVYAYQDGTLQNVTASLLQPPQV